MAMEKDKIKNVFKKEIVIFIDITIFRNRNMRCVWIYQIKMKTTPMLKIYIFNQLTLMLLPFS